MPRPAIVTQLYSDLQAAAKLRFTEVFGKGTTSEAAEGPHLRQVPEPEPVRGYTETNLRYMHFDAIECRPPLVHNRKTGRFRVPR